MKSAASSKALEASPQGDFSKTLRLPEKMTKTKLLAERKAEKIPHVSYDLDGDGFVGGKDYVVARRFDIG